VWTTDDLWGAGLSDAERDQLRLDVGRPAWELQNDEGGGLILARLLRPWLRYNPSAASQSARCWLVWTGTHWTPDVWRCHLDLARELAAVWDAYADDVRRTSGDDAADAVAKWADKCRQVGRLEAALKIASALPALRVTSADFDGPDCDYHLSCASGVIDVRTGDLHPHDPCRRMSLRSAPASYEPNADWHGTRWAEHVERVTCGDVELAAYLQRLAGAALWGVQREHVFALWHGPRGGNGKGTTIRALTAALGGGYVRKMGEGVLIKSRGRDSSGPAPDLVDFRGCRLIWTDELPDGAEVDANRVKSLTGGDTMRARGLFEGMSDTRPTWLLVAQSQTFPRMSIDGGMERRLQVMPWDARVTSDDGGGDEFERLLADERDAILAWAVQGSIAAYEHGIRPPQQVREKTARLMSEQDPIGAWIDEEMSLCTDGRAARHWIKSGEALSLYQQWYDEQGMGSRPPTIWTLVRGLRRYGVIKDRVRLSTGERPNVFIGLRRRIADTMQPELPARYDYVRALDSDGVGPIEDAGGWR